MKNRRGLLGILGITMALALPVNAEEPQKPPTGRFIVTLKPDAVTAAGPEERGLVARHVYHGIIHGWAGEIPLTDLKALANDPSVASIVPDSQVMLFEEGRGESAEPGELIPAGVQRVGASPGVNQYSGAGVGVAVLDTGLDLNQPDIRCSSNSFCAYGELAQDDNGHGTHVAGILAGLGRPHSVVGVAPEAVLYSVKVLDSHGNGYDSDIIAGLNWVVDNATRCDPPIKVVNMSLGRGATRFDGVLHGAVRAVVAAGITVVVAAGNDPDKQVRDMVPAGFPEVIAVASSTASPGSPSLGFGSIPEDAASFFTTSGPMESSGRGVAISAPGEEREDVDADWVTSVGILSTKLGGGTTRMSGTSMAAPHVAGAVALLYEKAAALGVALDPLNAKLAIMNGDRIGVAPLDSHTNRGYYSAGFSFDGEREGILNVPAALSFLDNLRPKPAPQPVPKSSVIFIGGAAAHRN